MTRTSGRPNSGRGFISATAGTKVVTKAAQEDESSAMANLTSWQQALLYEYQFLTLEHWDNAVLGAKVAAHNMVSLEPDRWPHLPLPAFWSGQFGVNIKSVGVCSFGDEIIFTQGSIKERRFAAAYGKRGRIVAAVTFNHAKWLEHYAAQIERSAAFPPPPAGFDRPREMKPVPAEFPDPHVPTSLPTVILTGHDPNERAAEFRARLH